VRGAISWAQVVQVRDAHRGVMVTTTLGVILFTVVIFGAAMPFFTRHLSPEDEPNAERKRNNSAGGGSFSGTLSAHTNTGAGLPVVALVDDMPYKVSCAPHICFLCYVYKRVCMPIV
jgi:hypothetical protein